MKHLSKALEQQVASRLRERGLVVWLDREGLYTEFVDELVGRHGAGDFFAPVVAFRGSFLDTLLALEPFETGLDPEPLLVHVPGHTDGTIRTTPLLEAYRAGTRFERSLDTLVREVAAGKASPEATEAFLSDNGITLAGAEEWLRKLLTTDSAGLAAYLQNLKPEWVLESLVQADSDLKGRVQTRQDIEDLQAYLASHTGFSSDFVAFYLEGEEEPSYRSLVEAFVAWLLSVEYVGDLNRQPSLPELGALRSLSTPLRKISLQLVNTLRDRFPDAYREHALQAEALLQRELDAGEPEDLGRIDTFSREDSRLLEAAAECLKEERWGPALKWATDRLESPSVWVQNDLSRRQEWTLVKAAAQLGQALVADPEPLKGVKTLEGALDRYTGSTTNGRTDGAQAVDRAHRQFEQKRMELLSPQLPHFTTLADAVGRLRERYRQWVDRLTGDFAQLCAEAGYIPDSALQQRTLYEQVVHPLTQPAEARVAFFMVDALRFEMACELANALEGEGARVHLKARLAELPSITSVGMNVLAPVCREGRLTLDKPFTGFRAGEYLVSSTQNRIRAMGERSLERHPGARKTPVDFKLHELANLPPKKLKKKLGQASLVVVHSREIDGSGEADVGLATFDRWLGQLRSAILHLHNAGLEEFVITSDHGFLLLDNTCQPVPYHGGTIDRRYILTDAPVKEDSMTTVALNALDYGGGDGYLMFLRDSRVFKSKGSTAATFVHGGNSLQERVIPVLTVSYGAAKALALIKYRLKAEAQSPAMGCSRIKVLLERAPGSQGLLDFAPGKQVAVALRVPDIAAEAVIKDAPGAEVVNQRIQLEVDRWIEVYFTLQGAGAAKAPVELYHPDGVEEVESCRLSAHFEVQQISGVSWVPAPAGGSTRWEENFEDERVRKVFAHIESYSSISEEELIGMLGTPREVRKFARRFEDYLALLSFHVVVETTASGKRYIKPT